MTLDLAITLLVLIGAVILFVTEMVPVDLVALMAMAGLLVTGIVTPAEGLSGFSNDATITVAAMFVLSRGLYGTGALTFLGSRLAALGRRNIWLATGAMMLVTGLASAFINNTAVVAVSLPIVMTAAREIGVSASRLLMPLSFAAIFGGVCTLIGTSTNLLVSALAAGHGLEPFGMFELSRLGLVLFAVGFAYLMLIGIRLIPERRTAETFSESFRLKNYVTEVVLEDDSPWIGETLRESLVRDLDVEVIEIRREGRTTSLPRGNTVLRAGDRLRIRCDVERVPELEEQKGLRLQARAGEGAGAPARSEVVLVEAVVAPGSRLAGRSLREVDFRNSFGATALAIQTRGRSSRGRMGRTQLRVGDVLLVEVPIDRLDQFKRNDAFVLVSEMDRTVFRAAKFLPAVLVMTGVVAAPTLGLLPITASAAAGAVLMVVLGCLTIEEAYGAISWRVISLLAGVIALGIALDRTGGARLFADLVIGGVGRFGPAVVISVFYLITVVLTAAMSNNATVALLVPIAVVVAEGMAMDARPLLMAVTFAASTDFMTPVGYQTNTMIFGPGRYRFLDFTKVGGPLNLLFWITASLLIPVLWPI